MKKLGFIAIVTSSVLVLSGCGSTIYEFAQPANKCGVNDVFLTVDEPHPVLNTEVQSEIELSVVDANGDEVAPAVLDTIEIEYRVGVFNSTGFPNMSPAQLSSRSEYYFDDGSVRPLSFSVQETPSPKPLPTREAFLDLFWALGSSEVSGQTERLLDGDLAFPVVISAATMRAPVIDFLAPPTVFADLSLGSTLELQLLLGALPGAFLVSCKLPGYEANPYVAAAQMFLNTSTVDFQPEAGFEPASEWEDFDQSGDLDEVLVLSLNRESQPSVNFLAGIGSILETGPTRYSDDPLTDRWLSFLTGESTPETNDESFQFRVDSVTDSTIRVSAMAPLAAGNYQMLLLYYEVEEFEELDFNNDPLSDEQLADLLLKSGTVHYDINVSSSGVYTFTYLQAPFALISRPVAANGQVAPELKSDQFPKSISTKGHRSLTLTGTDLNLISTATVGGKSAIISSKTSSSLTLSLPARRAGSHNLALSYLGGTILREDSVRYYKSQLIKTEVVGALVPRSQWLANLGKTIRETPRAVQINCVATVPEGAAGRALIKKARAACGEVSNFEPAIRPKVVIKKLDDGSNPSLKLRYWS